MKLPRILLERASFCGHDRGRFPVAVVQLSNFAAKELLESYLHDGWRRHELHLQTGTYDTPQFNKVEHRISVITYGVLWRWMTDFNGSKNHPLKRYGAFFLDEFSDLQPVYEMAVRSLGQLIRKEQLWPGVKIAAAGYGISPEYVDNLLGKHYFVTIPGRHHTLERCLVAPRTTMG